MLTSNWGILIDFDGTLVDLRALKPFLRPGSRNEAYGLTDTAEVPEYARKFIQVAKRHNWTVGVVSSESRRLTQAILAEQGLDDVNIALASGEMGHRRATPKDLRSALRKMRVSVKHSIYIGNAERDFRVANEAGMHGILLKPRAGRTSRTTGGAVFSVCKNWDEVSVCVQQLIAKREHHLKRLRAKRKLHWFAEPDNPRQRSLYVFDYHPRRYGNSDAITELILRFKDGDQRAVKHVRAVLMDTLHHLEGCLKEELCCRYIISAPSSKAGARNTPCERICAMLAREFSWLEHLPNALERTETLPKASKAPRGERPTDEDHFDTIEYRGRRFQTRKSSIILFDDVYTTGATSRACRQRLRRALGDVPVVGIFIARTR